MKNKPLLILGAGGHAATLLDILLKQNKKIVGVIAPEITANQIVFENMQHYTEDDDVKRFKPSDILLVNGIGSMPNKPLRAVVYNHFKKLGYKFATVIADSAKVSDYCILAEGVQVMNNCVLNIGSEVGENTIINTSASIDHDCNIDKNCHIAPGVTLSGQVTIEEYVHLGTGVSVINNITIGHNTVVGVGANITKSIPPNSVVYGARSVIKGLREDDN